MKILLLFAALLGFQYPAVSQSKGIPVKVKKLIESKFPKWEPAEIKPEIVGYFANYRGGAQPGYVTGDWNGDGAQDHAVLIQKKGNSNERRILALVKRGRDYQHFMLPGDDCLMLAPKGKSDYDFESRKTFVYKNDAIHSYIFEKAGTSFVLENGKFRSILTSD